MTVPVPGALSQAWGPVHGITEPDLANTEQPSRLHVPEGCCHVRQVSAQKEEAPEGDSRAYVVWSSHDGLLHQHHLADCNKVFRFSPWQTADQGHKVYYIKQLRYIELRRNLKSLDRTATTCILRGIRSAGKDYRFAQGRPNG